MSLSLRFVRAGDASALAEIYAPYVISTAYCFEVLPPSPDEMSRRIKQTVSLGMPYIVACEDDVPVGYAYASKYRERAGYNWNVESSVYVRQDMQGRGVGSALYAGLLQLLYLQGYYAVYAVVVQPNEASVALHQRMGFDPVYLNKAAGFKLGQWHDQMWMIHRLREASGTPEAVCPLGHVPQEICMKVLSQVSEELF